jgi:putative transport protein
MTGLEHPLLDFLRQQPVFTLFLVLGLGYLIGRVRIGVFSFGPVAGVLFAGMFFGRLGFSMAPGVQAVGFALFIFSVGYQAGPKFLEVIRTDGLRYFLLAACVAGSGFVIAWLWAEGLQLPPGGAAGLLAGGMTSSPTLAAAQEAVRSGNVAPPPGFTADQLLGNIATTYAITYIFGLAGLIAVIKLLPTLLRIDLVADARELERRSSAGRPVIDVRTRGYRVSNPDFCRTSVGDLRAKYWDRMSAPRVLRNGERIRLADEEFLQPGDELYIQGDLSQFLHGVAEIGEEIPVPEDAAQVIETAQVVVARKTAVGRRLQDLDLSRRLDLVVTGVQRDRIPIPVSPELHIQRGDILTVQGPREAIAAIGTEIGPTEDDVVETDMLSFACGIALGVLIGLVSIKIGGVPIGLGSAGGLLVSGILVGLLNATRPTVGKFPDAARWIFMEFGLLIFMTGVGLRAGADIIETFLRAGPMLILAGATVTLIPVLLGYLFGRRVLRIEPVLLLGAITGSMTSGASLKVVTDAARSPVPALGYTGCYAFANVLLTVAGTLIMLL